MNTAMPHMTLENIARSCNGTYIGPEELKNNLIAGAVTDSRQVEEGYLFIPIKLFRCACDQAGRGNGKRSFNF